MRTYKTCLLKRLKRTLIFFLVKCQLLNPKQNLRSFQYAGLCQGDIMLEGLTPVMYRSVPLLFLLNLFNMEKQLFGSPFAASKVGNTQ